MINQLKNIGLADKEAKVYLAMLELGPASVLEIAAKAGINRPTAYVQIESLKKMGLASSQTKDKKQLYIAEPPSQLEHILETKDRELVQQREELQKILPELGAMFNLGDEKPLVRYFEGKEGIQNLIDTFLKTKVKEIYGISPADLLFSVFPNHKSTYTPERVKRGIKSKLIYTSANKDLFPPDDPAMLRKAKHIAPEKLPLGADITIYGNKVSIISLRGAISGAIIESQVIADSFRSLFNLIWESQQ